MHPTKSSLVLVQVPGIQEDHDFGAPESCTNIPRNQKEARDIQSPLVCVPPFGSPGSSWIVSGAISARTALLKAGSLPERGFGGNRSWQKRCCR